MELSSSPMTERQRNYRATYRQFWDAVTQAARALLALGVQKGERVGVWAPNRYEWVVVQYATARVGAILVNINPAYKAVELEYALNQSGVSLLCLARGFRQTDYLAILGGARPVVAMQCTGLFEAGDALRNVVHDLHLPLFLLVGVRSYYLHQEGKTADNCPVFTEPIMRAWQIPYTLFDRRHTASDLADAYRRAEGKAAAVLIAEGAP